MSSRATTATRLGLLAAAIAVVAVLPALVSSFRAYELATVGIYFIALIGLNVLTGYSGQISLGHGAFVMIGGYTTAILVHRADMRDLWTIPIAGLVAGVAGYLFGFPALRLPGLYLALATFAVAVALPQVAKRWESLTGGSVGIGLNPVPKAPWGLPLSSNHWLYALSWSVAGLLLLVAWVLLRGRLGRTLRAIRDSEIAAASSGVNVAAYKTLAFGISAFYAGIAGALFAIRTAYISPDTFPVALSVTLLIGVVVGGLGSLGGLVAGAVLIEFLPSWAQQVTKSPGAPSVVYGVVVIAIVLALPAGLGGLLHRLFRRIAAGNYTRA